MVATDLLNTTAGNITQNGPSCGLIFEEKWAVMRWLGDLLCWLTNQINNWIGLQYIVGIFLVLLTLWVIKKLFIDK